VTPAFSEEFVLATLEINDPVTSMNLALMVPDSVAIEAVDPACSDEYVLERPDTNDPVTFRKREFTVPDSDAMDAVDPACRLEYAFARPEMRDPVRSTKRELTVPDSALIAESIVPELGERDHVVPPSALIQTVPSCARMIEPDGSVMVPFGSTTLTAEMVYSIEPVTNRSLSA